MGTSGPRETRRRLTFYWLIWPEDRTLVAHAPEGGEWRVIATLKDRGRARIPPFEAIELDLSDLLADA